jgi:ABC-type transport system involved in multi-copper enzyme maturation permease subunit
VNGTFAVARYTLIELSRRRILLVFFIIGALGIAAIGGAFKIISLASPEGSLSFGGGGPGGTPIDPAKLSRVTELSFVIQLIGVVGFFALIIAFAIGMTAIYHDLESGAAVGIFSKPVSRLAFTAGKVLAALAAMIVIVGLLSLETRLIVALFGGGLEGALWVETVAAVANAGLVMLIVLALATWMNNIIAAVVAFVYNVVIANVAVTLHQNLVAGNLGDNGFVKVGLNILYWLVPHHLMSDAQRQLAQAEFDLFFSSQVQQGQGGPTAAEFVNSLPGASDIQDIIWWVFLVVLMATLVYIAVRRKQV